MDNCLKFSEWLEINEGRSQRRASFAGIYPELYTQYYNYPPAASIVWSPDSITYMDPEDLVTSVSDNPIYAKIVRKTIAPYGRTPAGGSGD